MSKIYSRVRIINTKKIITIGTIIIIAIIVDIIICRALEPVFNTVCKEKAKNMATTITNQEVIKLMKKYNYDDLFNIERDKDGNISMIKSNVFPINDINSNISIKIQEEINKQGKNNIGIALGTFTGIRLLSGIGPSVKIRVSSVGNVQTDIKSEFISQGLNQTLHRVYIQIKCEIIILTPFNDMKESVTNQLLIAENVVIGKIPTNYYNIERMNNHNASNLIE